MAESNSAENSATQSPGKPRRFLRKLIIILSVGLALVVGIVLALGVAAHFWLKNTDLKTYVEQTLSSAVNGKASIDSAHVDLTKGINVKGIKLAIPDTGLVELDELDIQYSPERLMALELDIESVTLNRPAITLTPSDKQVGSVKLEELETNLAAGFLPEINIPFIPLPVNIRSLKINDLSFRQTTPTSKVAIDKVNIDASASASPLGIKASITVASGSDNPSLLFSDGETSLNALHDINLVLSLDDLDDIKLKGHAGLNVESATAPVEVKPGNLRVEIDSNASLTDVLTGGASLSVSLYDEPAIDLGADWEVADSKVDYTVKIKEIALPIERMVQLANIKDVSATGSIRLDTPLVAKGTITNDTSKHFVNGAGAVDLRQFVSGAIEAGKGVVLGFNFDNVAVTQDSLTGNINANVTLPSLKVEEYYLGDTTLTAKVIPSGQTKGELAISINLADAGGPDFKLDKTTLTINADGDFVAGDFDSIRAIATVAENTKIDLTGKVASFGKESLNVRIDASVPLAYWARVTHGSPKPSSSEKWIVGSGCTA